MNETQGVYYTDAQILPNADQCGTRILSDATIPVKAGRRAAKIVVFSRVETSTARGRLRWPPMFALTQLSNHLTLKGSFSAVSKPDFASKYAFESSRRDLQNALLCTVLMESR